MTAADEKMYLQDDPSEECGLQEICGKGYPGKNSHGEIVCFTGGCKFDTRARGTAPVCDDTCVYKRFAANMENAAARDAAMRAEGYEQGKKDALLERDNLNVSTIVGFEAGYSEGMKAKQAQHEQELRDAVEGARKEERERVLDEIDLDHILALCDDIIKVQDSQSKWGFNALLIRRKIESLRSTTGTPGEQEQRDSINFTLAPIPKEQEWKRELPPSMPEGGTDTMK